MPVAVSPSHVQQGRTPVMAMVEMMRLLPVVKWGSFRTTASFLPWGWHLNEYFPTSR